MATDKTQGLPHVAASSAAEIAAAAVRLLCKSVWLR